MSGKCIKRQILTLMGVTISTTKFVQKRPFAIRGMKKTCEPERAQIAHFALRRELQILSVDSRLSSAILVSSCSSADNWSLECNMRALETDCKK